MAKKLYGLTVRGRRHTWSFNVYVDPAYVDDWLEDGLQIEEIVNTIPARVVDFGFTRAWCFLQDIFHLRNPFR